MAQEEVRKEGGEMRNEKENKKKVQGHVLWGRHNWSMRTWHGHAPPGLCAPCDVAVDPLSLSTIARLGLSDRHGQQACALGCAECTPIRSRPRGPPVWSPEAEKGGVSIRFRVCRLPTVFDFYIVTKERACHSLLATQTRASRAGLAL